MKAPPVGKVKVALAQKREIRSALGEELCDHNWILFGDVIPSSWGQEMLLSLATRVADIRLELLKKDILDCTKADLSHGNCHCPPL